MKLANRIFTVSLIGLVAATAASSQEKVDPPPAKADDITIGFKAYVIAEPRFAPDDIRNPIGKKPRNPVDLVTEHGLAPVIAVFSRAIPADANAPLAAVVKKLDALADDKDYKARRLGTFLVFLSLQNEFRKDPTVDARTREILQFVAGVKPTKTTIALAEATETPDGTEQPLVPAQVQAFGIGAEDDLVIVFYYKFTVIKRWKFKASAPPTEDDLTALGDEVAKLLSPKKK